MGQTQDFKSFSFDGATTTSGSTSSSGKRITINRLGPTSSGGEGTGGSRNQTSGKLPVYIEQLVRSFESPVIQSIRAQREAREADNQDSSLLRWGAGPKWGNSSTSAAEDEQEFTITNSRPSPRPNETTRIRIYSEVSRTTETVRVTNPQDSNQWVDVQRITSITFRGQDNVDVRFDLNPPS